MARPLIIVTGLLAAGALLTACSGAPAPNNSGSASVPTSDFTVLTPKPTTDAGALTWAVYRETQTLDPIQRTLSTPCSATRCCVRAPT